MIRADLLNITDLKAPEKIVDRLKCTSLHIMPSNTGIAQKRLGSNLKT